MSIDPLRLEHRNRSGHNSVLFTRRVAGSAMNAQKASTLLEKAAQALRGHGLMVSVQKQDGSEEGRWRSATCLGVHKDRCGTDYAAEVRCKVTSDSLGSVVTQLRQPVDVGDPPLLLITDHVTRPVAHRLREQEQQFADTAGNAYLEARGLFVYVSGRKPDDRRSSVRTDKGFIASRLKVLFALICDSELAAAPYRVLAGAADVSPRTVLEVLADLQRDGSLTVVDRRRRLNASKRLLDDWAQAYALGLRGSGLTGRYRAAGFAAWADWQLHPAQARWGGEPAATLLACDLQPSVLTIYADKLSARLVAQQKLAAAGPVAYQNLLEVRKPFWGRSLSSIGQRDTVPPALVYADLLATGNPRCLAAARAIYEVRLARLFPEA